MINQMIIAVFLTFGLALTATAAQTAAQGGAQKDDSGQQSSMQQKGSEGQASDQKMQKQKSGQGEASDQQMQSQKTNKGGQESGNAKTADTFIEQQKSSQVLASSLIGITVKNGAGKNAKELGTINDLIMNQQHQLVGVVIGVGGFLGIGQKSVGVSWDAVQNLDPQKGIAVVNATQKQVQNAPSFTTTQEKQQKQKSQQVKQQQQTKQQQLKQPQQPPAGGGTGTGTGTGGGNNNM